MKNFKADSEKKLEDFIKEVKEEMDSQKQNIEKRLKDAQLINIATILSIAVSIVSIMTYAFNTIKQLRDVNLIKQETIYDIQKQYDQLIQDHAQLTQQMTDLEKRLKSLEDDNAEEASGKNEN